MLGRNLFLALLGGAAYSARGQAVSAPVSRFVTRRIDELTSREVEFCLQEGGDVAIVPLGRVSGHGAFIPVGLHARWASALSLLLAEKANGRLAFPATFACFAGDVRGLSRQFRGDPRGAGPLADPGARASRPAGELVAGNEPREPRHGGDIDMTVEILHKCADLAVPALANFAHHEKWLSEHPLEYIKATDRLEEKVEWPAPALIQSPRSMKQETCK